jgi:hypothetical protein
MPRAGVVLEITSTPPAIDQKRHERVVAATRSPFV